MNTIGKKMQNIALIAFLLIAISVVPVAAASPSETSCSAKSPTATAEKPVSTKVSGSLADSMSAKAIKNSDIQALQAQMAAEGFVQKEVTVYSVVVPKAKAAESSGLGGSEVSGLALEKTDADEYYVVGIRYDSPEGETEYLHYIENKKTGETFVLRGSFDCVVCLFELGGAGAACFGICTTLGGFTGGVACGMCIGLAPLYVACPCWSCGCQMGQEFMCVAYDLKC
jgi:hypothetical protein